MQQDAAKPQVPPPAAVAAGRFQRPQLPGVIFDSDMGANIDAVLALAVLYGAAGKVKVIGVTVSNPNLESAAFCDAMGRFYAGGVAADAAFKVYYFPIGFEGNSRKFSSNPMLAKPLAMKSQDGKALFGTDIRDNNDTADVALVFRNSLLTQKDGEGIVVMAGPATNLVRALTYPGNRELIAAKAGVLIVAAGSGLGKTADQRIAADIPSARKLFNEWPTPIVSVGRDVGIALPYPAASVQNDFAWSPHHPVAEAYAAFRPMPYDAPSQAVIAALYATDLKTNLFALSAPGKIEVLDDGRTRLVPSASGSHRYINADFDADRKERIVKAFTSLAAAKPAAPAGRGPRFQQQNAAAGQQNAAQP